MFKDKLKQLRIERNLTQAEVAHAIGVSAATIGNYEQGTRQPRSNEVWQKLADCLGISVDELMDKTEKKTKRIARIIKSDESIKIYNLCKIRTDSKIIYNGVDITPLLHLKEGESISITRDQRYASIEFTARSGHVLYARSQLLEIIYDIKKYSRQEIINRLTEIVEFIDDKVIYWYNKCWLDMEDIFFKVTTIDTLYDLINQCLALDTLATKEFYLVDIEDNFDWLREKLHQ